ncbi:winged helix-turn-helix transcriptional regulator [Streptoalloteichus hindustanus]|uniref:winged helix-turn-helix transcriptional regulator n=1 Tax=Streptoalloteichus hindustanus TaxID=2017 RepID=UPI001F227FE5|nr:helix-turn-helix domain-containing protein [Streptoalloteichus hindustanus]
MVKRRTYTCGVDAAIDVMGGKWKALILWELSEGPLRFGELRRRMHGISERVLIVQVREMETAGLLHREQFNQVPPRVEYSLTEFGRSLLEAMMPLAEWGERNMRIIEAIPRDGDAPADPQPAATTATG